MKIGSENQIDTLLYTLHSTQRMIDLLSSLRKCLKMNKYTKLQVKKEGEKKVTVYLEIKLSNVLEKRNPPH